MRTGIAPVAALHPRKFCCSEPNTACPGRFRARDRVDRSGIIRRKCGMTPSAELPDLAALEEAAALVHTVVPATPQYCWPLLSRRVGAELWVKHENHTPTGAFKVRGGVVYLGELRKARPEIRGVVTATTGHHG